MKTYIFIFYIIFNSSILFSKEKLSYKIFDTRIQMFIDDAELSRSLIKNSSNIILGESHYTKQIQISQAKVINDYVLYFDLVGHFATHWEFLNNDNQERITIYFDELINEKISTQDFFKHFFSKKQIAKSMIYAPIIETTKSLKGSLFATNASRKIKSIITKSGIKALGPKYIPQNMRLGGKQYKERFISAMGNHVPKNKIQNYFEAQSYTDSVIANAFTNNGQDIEANFLIIGSFHSDYNDGVIKQIDNILGPAFNDKNTSSIKFIMVKNLKKNELNQHITPHTKHGHLADFLYFIKEL